MPHAGEGLYHRYNAVLKRVFANKGRARMTLPELEAALAWLERNRLSDHLDLLDGDSRYAWTATRRRRALWKQLYPQSESTFDRSADAAAAHGHEPKVCASVAQRGIEVE